MAKDSAIAAAATTTTTKEKGEIWTSKDG